MDYNPNASETLLHMTSRGSSVQTAELGNPGQFINFTSQPINDVNKIGLLHYVIVY